MTLARTKDKKWGFFVKTEVKHLYERPKNNLIKAQRSVLPWHKSNPATDKGFNTFLHEIRPNISSPTFIISDAPGVMDSTEQYNQLLGMLNEFNSTKATPGRSCPK